MTQANNTVAEQVTDSITQTSVGTLGVAPAHAMATLYQTSAAAASIAIQNAVHAQNNQNAISRAVTAQAIHLLMTSPTAAQADAAGRMNDAFAALNQRMAELTAALAAVGK